MDIKLTVEGVSPTTFEVVRYEGHEEISQPFRFKIHLMSEDSHIDGSALLGKGATLHVADMSSERQIHGVIGRFSQESAGDLTGKLGITGKNQSRYAAVLVPRVELLRHTLNSRIFQDVTVPEIVQKVLEKAGLPSSALELGGLTKSYGKRNYCVQHQESDLNFVCRLLEEEGIFFFFQHGDSEEVMVLVDDQSGDRIAGVPGAAKLAYLEHDPAKTLVVKQDAVYKLSSEANVGPGTLILQDYRFKHPNMEMGVEQSDTEFARLAYYEFPGGYTDPKLGDALANVRQQEVQAQRHLFLGETTTRMLLPGYKLSIFGNLGRPSYNQEYLLLATTHYASRAVSGSEAAGQNRTEFVAIPMSVPFRPRRRTSQPRVNGVETATVVGPANEEIHADEFGRVLVRFHWDRDGEQNEAWVRVCHPWAGAGFGAFFLPRVGHEVVVQFLHGDPDRPIIVGAVHNGINSVPYALPKNKTRTTLRTKTSPGGKGFNELRFEDAKGHEEIFLHAQKDLNEKVLNDHTAHIDGSETIKVGGSQSTTVQQHISVKTVEGNYKFEASKGKSDLTSQLDIHVKSVAGGIFVESPAKIELKVGSSTITIEPSGVTIKAPKVDVGATGTISSIAAGDHVIKGSMVKINS